MAIEFSCQDCGQRFSRPEQDAGRQGRCPCGATVYVPTIEAIAAREPVFTPPEPLPVEHDRSPSDGKCCPFCSETIKSTARKCRYCGEMLDGSTSPGAAQAVIHVEAPRQKWHPGVAMVLSFIVPGLGQLYKGDVIGALIWFFVTAVGYVLLIFPGLCLHFACVCTAGMGDPTK